MNIGTAGSHTDEAVSSRSFCGAVPVRDVVSMMFESKLKNDPVINIEIDGYKTPCLTNTESEKGGTMLYVLDGINFKPRKDLEIYQSKELESTFIEIINPKESNDIIGVIYRHPHMNTDDFTDHKLSLLMDKLTSERNKNFHCRRL